MVSCNTRRIVSASYADARTSAASAPASRSSRRAGGGAGRHGENPALDAGQELPRGRAAQPYPTTTARTCAELRRAG
eukprot:scaffold47634_cov34-Phaeocystis_antarctica.AAC.3